MRKGVLLLLSLAILSTGAFLSFKRIDAMKAGLREEGRGIYIPSSQFLRPAVLGYDAMVADLYWLKSVQYIGDRYWFKKRYPQIYPLLDLVTDMDPKFEYAYEVGGIILSVYGRRIDESIALLKKGYKNDLGYWEIPFYIGFNYFYYLGDYETAADYLEKAVAMPRSPAYLPKLVARLRAQAGKPSTALEFLKRVYNSTDDENVRKELEKRMKEVMVERDIQFLEGAIKVFKERFGRAPDDIALLVSKGIINRIPEEPFGGYYYIDPETHEVKSSVVKERLRVYRQNLIKGGKKR